MRIEFRHEPLAELPCSVLATSGFEGCTAASGTIERLPAETRAQLEELQSAGELPGKAYECTLIHRPAGLAARKLLVVGAGKKEKFNDSQLRRLVGTAARHLRARGIHDLAWVLGPDESEAVTV